MSVRQIKSNKCFEILNDISVVQLLPQNSSTSKIGTTSSFFPNGYFNNLEVGKSSGYNELLFNTVTNASKIWSYSSTAHTTLSHLDVHCSELFIYDKTSVADGVNGVIHARYIRLSRE